MLGCALHASQPLGLRVSSDKEGKSIGDGCKIQRSRKTGPLSSGTQSQEQLWLLGRECKGRSFIQSCNKQFLDAKHWVKGSAVNIGFVPENRQAVMKAKKNELLL